MRVAFRLVDRLVHLVRHGEAENPEGLIYGSLVGFGLSDRGRRQAEAAAAHLAGADGPNVVAIFASPLRRTRETAAILAERLDVSCRQVADLHEWRLAERWHGHAWDELEDAFPGELQAYLDHPADLSFSPESLQDLATRTSGAIRSAADRHPSGSIVVVGHQDPLQAARLALTARNLETLHVDKPGHAAVISLRPGLPWTEETSWMPPAD